jgi:hypothetical protein
MQLLSYADGVTLLSDGSVVFFYRPAAFSLAKACLFAFFYVLLQRSFREMNTTTQE